MDAIFLSKACLAHLSTRVPTPDGTDITFSELAPRGSFALEVSFPPHHVDGILPLVTKIKMVRVGAGRIVACMQHIHPVRNLTAMENPANLVRSRYAVFGNSDTTVAMPIFGTIPIPTSIRQFRHLCIETLAQCFHRSLTYYEHGGTPKSLVQGLL